MRSKIVYTFMMLVIFRLGSVVPVPGMDIDYVRAVVNQVDLLSFFDLFSGGAFSNMTIFALSITPYITASIIMQLLTIAIPSLEELAKEGEEGRKRIATYTRYATVVLALIQAAGITIGLFGSAIRPGAFNVTLVIITLTAGTSFLMWLGEQITEKGIGNGISLIIFAGIVSGLPATIRGTFFQLKQNTISPISIILILLISLIMIVAVVAISEGTRKIPVQYAKRVVGRKMYGGQSSHIPLKVNQAGVIPVIFAMSLLSFPQILSFFFGQDSGFAIFIQNWLSPTSPYWYGIVLYSLLSAALIIFFTFFYTMITFNPIEISTNMKKYGGFIPGIRPGRPTTDYITRVSNRITLAGAAFLALVAVLPTIVLQLTGAQMALGGTALLIVVGVALETMKQIEAQLMMRHYQGFLK
nr:preprotein translocase subunit SecY [Alkaliphilus hydrothermalis]